MSCVLRFLAFLLFCFLLRFNELCKRIEDPSLVLLTHYYLSFVLANKMRRNYGGEDRQTHNEPYGDLVPFGDPNWYRGYASPFYKKNALRFPPQMPLVRRKRNFTVRTRMGRIENHSERNIHKNIRSRNLTRRRG